MRDGREIGRTRRIIIKAGPFPDLLFFDIGKSTAASMIDESLRSVRIEFLRRVAPRTPDPPVRHCVEFSDAVAAARWKRETGRHRRAAERESESASRPAREERRCGLSTRSPLRLDACACHRQSLPTVPRAVLPATRRSTQRRCGDGGTSSASHDSVLALPSVLVNATFVRSPGCHPGADTRAHARTRTHTTRTHAPTHSRTPTPTYNVTY